MKCAGAAVLMLSVAASGQVAPVDIVGAPGAAERAAERAAQTSEPAGRSIPIAIFVAGAVGFSITGAAGWWAWRRWSTLDATERAFLLLSLRSGVRHTERGQLRELASQQGATPVAVLLTGSRQDRDPC